jgi:hypothetical protein
MDELARVYQPNGSSRTPSIVSKVKLNKTKGIAGVFKTELAGVFTAVAVESSSADRSQAEAMRDAVRVQHATGATRWNHLEHTISVEVGGGEVGEHVGAFASSVKSRTRCRGFRSIG